VTTRVKGPEIGQLDSERIRRKKILGDALEEVRCFDPDHPKSTLGDIGRRLECNHVVFQWQTQALYEYCLKLKKIIDYAGLLKLDPRHAAAMYVEEQP